MKKTLVVAAGLAVLSTSAFATKSRMTALNQDSGRGSYYMDDERNAFRMAGSFSGNYVYVEHGASATSGVGGTAEGGFFREGASMSYGLYLNSSEHGQLDSSTGTGVTVDPARVDLFLRSNSGMNWGVRLGYESVTVDATDEDGSAFDLSVNADLAGANVWLTYVPATDALTSGASQEADMSLGATYAYGDHTLFAEYSSEGGADGADAESTITLGAGRTMSTDSGMFFYDVKLESISNEGHNDKVSKLALPVTFGFEAQATSWLSWRASIQQSLFGSRDTDGDKSSARTTTFGVGASLNWGSLRLDGVVSNTAAIGTNDLMSNVSAVYNF
jgi:hypothetical protein